MTKLTPCPSPRGTNRERLFLVRVPHSGPAGAYDAEREEPSPAALQIELDKILCEAGLAGEQLERARHRIDHHLGGSQYDRAYEEKHGAEDEEEEIEESPSRKEMRRILRDEDFTEDEIEEFLGRLDKARDSALPRPATRGGLGGALGDRQARDRDRRIAADSAAQRRFTNRFPEAARVVSDHTTSFTGAEARTRGAALNVSDTFSRFPGMARIGKA
ncbi:MAG: hypothetical protein AB1508_16760 [Pseudomonadota bacterium]